MNGERGTAAPYWIFPLFFKPLTDSYLFPTLRRPDRYEDIVNFQLLATHCGKYAPEFCLLFTGAA
jgi:hypothetical protein